MKSTELRIGNYYDDNGEVRIVNPNTIEEVWTAERSWCKPIPLNEEWLLKLGAVFSFNEHFNFYTLNKIIIIEASKGSFFFKCGDIIVEIKYVHTLQNFVFSLTNEELTLKP